MASWQYRASKGWRAFEICATLLLVAALLALVFWGLSQEPRPV